jgi:2-dehydro-3-deoxyphosphogluconate aldolase/(4S)-4-hydroxy-2-oxoglutarate aldolase
MQQKMDRQSVLRIVEESKIVTIARKVPHDRLLPAADALIRGGIRLLEVTFDQASPTCLTDTPADIARLGEAFGEKLCVGAGTVITKEQVAAAYEAGARFIVSPNTDPEIIAMAKALGLVTFPGALTPTEILNAYQAGADFVKIFPAETLGLPYIKSVMAPISHVPLVAVGGVNEDNIADFLNLGLKGVGIGSNILKKSYIETKNYDGLAELARRYTAAAGVAR